MPTTSGNDADKTRASLGHFKEHPHRPAHPHVPCGVAKKARSQPLLSPIRSHGDGEDLGFIRRKTGHDETACFIIFRDEDENARP